MTTMDLTVTQVNWSLNLGEIMREVGIWQNDTYEVGSTIVGLALRMGHITGKLGRSTVPDHHLFDDNYYFEVEEEEKKNTTTIVHVPTYIGPNLSQMGMGRDNKAFSKGNPRLDKLKWNSGM